MTPDDLTPFATIDATKAQAMIDDALALAARVAPCILEDTFTYDAAAKAILRGAILRWNEAGTGAMQQQTAGPYGMTVDTRQQRKGMFWPSEIEQLQDLCKGEETSGAFAIDTVGTGGTAAGHAESCALNFGALYCSCGYVLTQSLPLYGA
jgi:hypothetical protein